MKCKDCKFYMDFNSTKHCPISTINLQHLLRECEGCKMKKDGIIELDTDFAKEIGFISKNFDGWLWLEHGYVIISFIISKQKKQGNLSKLFDAIFDKGFGIKVPTPTRLMKRILREKRFELIEEYDEFMQPVEIWVRK